MIGCSMPNISVIAVFICLSRNSVALLLHEERGNAARLEPSNRRIRGDEAPAHSPLLAEGPDFVLESPGVAGLLIELPIGFGDRGRAHQAGRVQILHRL